MFLVFLDRTPRKRDPWLQFKVWSFTVGAVLALCGIYFEEDWMIWAAIGVLLLGFGARFLGAPPSSGDEDQDQGEDEIRDRS